MEDNKYEVKEEKDNVCEINMEEEETSDFENLSRQEIHTIVADPTIESLDKEMTDGYINLQPKFQRRFVWDKKKASTLIESILLGVPLPIIYLSEEDNGKLHVIDGQQRLSSIKMFIDGKFEDNTEFKLTSLKVKKELNGKKYQDLPESLQRQIMRYPIRTITFQKNSGKDIKFDIFERLNCGSVALNDMELRNCIYRGEYLDTIKDLSKNKLFRQLIGLSQDEKRMKDIELVLRFFAFSNNTYLNYKSPMKKFLNEDCEKYKNYTKDKLEDLIKKFKDALYLINSIFGENAFKRFFKDSNNIYRWEDRKFNISLYDVYMWVFSRQDKNKVMRNSDLIREATIHLMAENEEFINATTRGTSGNKEVKSRFSIYDKLIEDILKQDPAQKRCFSYDLKKQWFEKNPTCAICGNQIMTIDDAAIDHIEQYWQGGKTIEENGRLTHRLCNMKRPRKENI